MNKKFLILILCALLFTNINCSHLRNLQEDKQETQPELPEEAQPEQQNESQENQNNEQQNSEEDPNEIILELINAALELNTVRDELVNDIRFFDVTQFIHNSVQSGEAESMLNIIQTNDYFLKELKEVNERLEDIMTQLAKYITP